MTSPRTPDRGEADARAPAVAAVGRALPPHAVDQEALLAALSSAWGGTHRNLVGRLAGLHRAVQVRERHFALPLEEYPALTGFAQRNEAWRRCALDLGARAACVGLDAAGLAPADVDHVFFVSTTGIATPSVDALLVNRLGMRGDVRRSPLFGLGCAGGAAGLARAADWLLGHPDGVALLVAVELCSLTFRLDDLSVANLIASGLFGDGAAAVVLTGAARAGAPGAPRLLGSASSFYRDTERVMGWDVEDAGFKIVLSAEVPAVVGAHIAADVDAFLGARGLARSDVRHWLAHTGGPRVLEAFEGALALPAGALERSWRSLAEAGNLSSASVLFVLGDLLDSGDARPGDLGLLAAMGPGFCAELALLRW